MLHQFFYTQSVRATSSKYHVDFIKMLLSFLSVTKGFLFPLESVITFYFNLLEDKFRR